MSNRQILVIGSQCEAIRPPLSFLPQLGQDLFQDMTNPEIGQCSPEASRLVMQRRRYNPRATNEVWKP